MPAAPRRRSSSAMPAAIRGATSAARRRSRPRRSRIRSTRSTNETIVPEAMTQARIAETIAAFAAAAARARQAGFDCVEIHAAHGYLISQFHTPFENRRTDEYGGSLENRARFGLEVLRAVKAAAPTCRVIYRLSVEDYFPGGMPYAEGRQIALWAAEAGADALHIAAGHYRSLPSAAMQLPPMALPDAHLARLCRRHEARRGDPGDRGRPARRSRRRAPTRSRAARRISSRSAAPSSPIPTGWRNCARGEPHAPLPRLQHLHQRDARRRAHRLRRQRRRRAARRALPRRRAASGAAHRGDRRRPGRAELRLARRRRQRGHGVRARRPCPAAPSAMPARRRSSRRSRPIRARFARYIAQLVAACVHKGVTLPLRHRRARNAGAARSRSTGSSSRPARAIASARLSVHPFDARSPAWRAARRVSHAVAHSRSSRLVLPRSARRDRRPVAGAGRARSRRSPSSAIRSMPAKAKDAIAGAFRPRCCRTSQPDGRTNERVDEDSSGQHCGTNNREQQHYRRGCAAAARQAHATTTLLA